jgi:hypothetical protein
MSLNLDEIRKLAIISLFTDDYLLNKLVLKGGNALYLVYNIDERSSIDIDLSIESDFKKDELILVKKILKKNLEDTFIRKNLIVFDFEFQSRPTNLNNKYKEFWGGYRIYFKIIEKDTYELYKGDLDSIRKDSIVVGPKNIRKLKIEISKYEICKPKNELELDGFTIYVYSPIMIIYEKIRAICQQLKEYSDYVKTNRTPRARDFYDIHTIIKKRPETENDLYSMNNLNILREMFKIKRVPLNFLNKINLDRDYHKDNFYSVKDTIFKKDEIKDFEYYFDYVENICKKIIDLLENKDSTS